MLIYYYYRYGILHNTDYDTLNDAIERALDDHESGEACFFEIVDGERVYSNDEIMEMIIHRQKEG